MSRLAAALALSCCALLPACTWVKIEPEAKQIRVVDTGADMSSCGSMLSEITVSVRDRVGFVDRNAIKVRDELETLARNQASGGQADTLKPLSEPMNGEQRFGAWRCAGALPGRSTSPVNERARSSEDIEIIPLKD